MKTKLTQSNLEAICPKCGTLVTAWNHKSQLDSIAGYEHVKRGLEVALVGKHPVILLWSGNAKESALRLGRWGAMRGLTIHVVSSCPCGNFGDPTHECKCTTRQITRQLKVVDTALEASNILLEVPTLTSPQDKMARKGESDVIVVKRVEEAKMILSRRDWISIVKPEDLKDSTASSLLRTAIQQLCFDQWQIEKILAVTNSIWALAGGKQFSPAYLAEAIQYTPRRRTQ